MELPTLYKITAAGKVQQWCIKTEGNVIITSEGLQDGKKKEHRVTITDQKRSTSLAAQADSEAGSKWRDKKKTYFESVAEARGAGTNLTQGGYSPMLAHEFSKYAHKITFPCYVQPKVDGIRCISRKVDGEVGLFSRKGLPINNMPHIVSSLGRVMEDGEIWDGELYKHGQDFNELSGTIRGADKDTSNIDYVVYDFPRVGRLNETSSYRERLNWIHGLTPTGTPISATTQIANNVKLLATGFATSIDQVDGAHDEFVGYGYEGAIVRDMESRYENKRSQTLLKYKKFEDAEFPIIGFAEGRGKLEGCIGAFELAGPTYTFWAKLKAPEAELRRLFNHPAEFLNKHLTVLFQGRSAVGVPRFPVGKAIRG